MKALAQGENDPRKLAALARGKLKEKSLSLERALHGRLTVNQRFVLRESLHRWEELETADARVTKEIDKYVQADPKLARAREILDSIPGIGLRVAEGPVHRDGDGLVEMAEGLDGSGLGGVFSPVVAGVVEIDADADEDEGDKDVERDRTDDAATELIVRGGCRDGVGAHVRIWAG